MKLDSKKLLLYAVTDRKWLGERSLAGDVEESLKGGVTFLQLREKNLSDEEFLKEALEIKEICKKYDVPFIINDNVKVAIQSDADGIHVGQKDMLANEVRTLIGKNKILGVSVQSVEQAILAQDMGADYLGVGSIFPTNSKNDAEKVEISTLKEICKAVNIPVVAIGGITKENINLLKESGIVGVAVISDIYGQKDIRKASSNLKKAVLTIAGSDCSGGAGIQADIKTMTTNGVYGMSVITALTAQNTLGVSGILEVDDDFLKKQMDSVFTDIFPEAVKIGMLSSKSLILTISKTLKEYGAKNIVVDPVMVSTSGSKLIEDDAIQTMCDELFPLARVITPNIPEAEILSGMKIKSKEDMLKAGKIINEKYGCSVLCKGGHNLNDANDLLVEKNSYRWFEGKRIDNPNTHGTGCTLSSAIASNLAKGMDLENAIENAKEYISNALSEQMNLGKGRGPLDHGFMIKK